MSETTWQTDAFLYNGTMYVGKTIGPVTMWHAPDAKGMAIDGIVAMMPSVGRFWADDVREVYAWRVVANLTQRCPACGSEDVVGSAAAPRLAQLNLEHERDCRLLAGTAQLEAHVRGTATVRHRRRARSS